ncbi:MAG TPA: hypothetical protein DCZ51_15660 [Bacteroidales bacterium]|nr:hypothetical protein [Bacteroidales bacterium]
MELDDFKKKDKKNMDFTKVDDNSTSDRIDDMINLFRSHEKNQRKKVLNIIVFILSLATIYIAIMSSQNGIAQLGYFILGMSLFVAVLYLWFRYRPLSPKSYSLPHKQFVEIAVRKLSYFNTIDYIILIPLLGFIGTGGGIVFISRLSRYTGTNILLIIIWVLFFISLCVIGFWAGKKNWQKEYGEIHKKIVEMKNLYSSGRNSLEEI